MNETDPFLAEVNRRRTLYANRQFTCSIFAIVSALIIGGLAYGEYKLICVPIFLVVAFVGPILFPNQDDDSELKCPRCQDVPSYRRRNQYRQCENCFYPNPSSAYWKEMEGTKDVIGDQWKT